MNINEIAAALTEKGYSVNVKGDRAYINATPNGGRNSYGYIVAAESYRDAAKNISKRSGEICESLAAIGMSR